MIADVHPLFQTFLGTLFTWGLTALGSALVFVFNSGQVDYCHRFELMHYHDNTLLPYHIHMVMLGGVFDGLQTPNVIEIYESKSFFTLMF